MIRLLGDMRAYNYVVIPIHDFDQVIYRIRAIDFDQQSFEGKLSVYRPQFFKENYPLIKVVKEKLNHESIIQYKIEERSILSRRLINSGNRIDFCSAYFDVLDSKTSLVSNTMGIRELLLLLFF